MRLWLRSAILLCCAFLMFQPLYLHAQQETVSTRRILSRVVPKYPDLARSMRIAGTVKVLVVVAPNGRPTSTKVNGGHPLLARAATDAIEKWRWISTNEETKELVELHFHPE